MICVLFFIHSTKNRGCKIALKKIFILVALFYTHVLIAQEYVHVHFIDVGQGDATFIDCGDFEILIDAGNNQYGDDVSAYINEYVYGSLDIVIATHPDADHIGGLDIILNDYTVTTIIDSGKEHTTKTYKDYVQAVFNELGVTFLNDSDMIFDIGEGVTFSIIELVDDRTDNNENSVVSMLSVNDIQLLFMADIESALEIDFLNKFKDIDVLKVGHHGSRTSTAKVFLRKTNPEYAIISCGKNNQYGHPHKEVLERLENFNVEIFRTDELGTIVATVQGDEIIFEH